MALYHQTFEDEIVTIDWISNNIQKYGLTRKDLMNDLGLSKTVFLSLYLSGKRNLTIKDGENSIVIDTKYKLRYLKAEIHEDIRQVSGYARLKKVRNEVNIMENDYRNIDCLIIYPQLDEGIKDFRLENIRNKMTQIKAYHKIFKLGIYFPTI